MTDAPTADRDHDRQLVERARRGDTAAFDALVLKFTPPLYAVVYNMTAHTEDTADLLQEIFARAWRCLPRFRGDSSPHTWLHRIAVNAALNFLRRRRRRPALMLEELGEDIRHDPDYLMLSREGDPVRESGLRELQEQLNLALLQLPEVHRAVVVLVDIQGLPHEDVARILRVSRGTLRSRLFYAHRKLRVLLAGYLTEGRPANEPR